MDFILFSDLLLICRNWQKITLRIGLLGIVLSMLPYNSEAQDYTLNLKTFDVEDGLLHRDVHAVFEDKDGIIWIGSEKGLQRFDGHDFKPWTTKTAPLGKMAHITSIEQDKEGWLWLWNNHLLEFVFLHTQTEEILSQAQRFGTDFPIKQNIKAKPRDSGWSGERGRDSKGNLYFISNNPSELITYNSAKRFSRYPLEELKGKQLHLHHIDSQDILWITDYYLNSTLYGIDTQGKIVHQYEFLHDYIIHRVKELNGFLHYTIDTPKASYFYKIDQSGNHVLIDKKIRKPKHPRFVNDFTWDYYEDSLLVYAEHNIDKPIFNLHLNDVPKQFTNDPTTIYKDSKGRYWFPSALGLGLAIIKPKLFKTYFSFKDPIEKPINNSARGILIEEDTLYANFEFGGLVRIPLQKPDQWAIINRADKSETYFGRPLAKATTGGFYIGEVNNRVYHIDPKLNSKVNLTFLENKKSPPKASWSFYTAPDQKLWIGMDEGIAYKNPDEDYLQFIHTGDSLLRTDVIQHFCPDKAGKLWLSGIKGLYLFDPVTKSFLEKYSNVASGDFHIPVETFYYLYIDSDGIFWLGTNEGLLRWDRKTKEQRLFTTVDGLSNDVVYAIFEDAYNKLWLSSDYGIMQFDKTTFHVNAFLEKDGIAQQEFNRTSAFQEADGTIYFGGLNGITAFHPNNFYQLNRQESTAMLISDFEIFDGASASLLNKVGALRKTNTINFYPDDRFFRLKFALSAYEDMLRVNYAWMIEGVDKDWNYQKEPTLQIGKLPYGTHTLRIKGQSSAGQWSPHELAIQVKVHKPFYLQFWFLLLSLLGLLAALFSFYKIRTKALNKRQKLLEAEIEKATAEIQQDKQTIEEQSEELRQLDKVKSRFFANVSHELRTPLTLILGPIGSVLKRNQLSNHDFTHLKKAQQSGKDLLKMVASILSLSKMESGKLDLVEKPELLFPLIRRIASAFESHAQREKIQFSFEYLAEKNLQLELDKGKLEIIFNNLLSNAIKFTPPGGRIAIKIEDLENAIQIVVEDNGRGIHEKDLPFVFDRFYQSRQADAPTEGGTGIGLALSQELTKMMGGKIWVESEFGKGSTFFLKLPRKEILGAPIQAEQMPIEPQEEITTMAQSLETINGTDHQPVILIVEDNYSLRDYLQSILSPIYKIWTAENGSAALNLLQENQAALPALVITDIMMPVMDGFQLLTTLKSTAAYKHLPVIMLTARADIQDKVKALRIGVDDYLLKPFEEEELLVRIENLLSNYQERLEAQATYNNAPSEDAKAPSNTPVITLEDQEWLAALENHLKQQISNSGYTISQLAHDMSISERQLRRRTKILTGLSPTQYLKEIRMQAARQLLEQRRYKTIAQVASTVGFQDAGAFTRNFSKRFGKIPSEYLLD